MAVVFDGFEEFVVDWGRVQDKRKRRMFIEAGRPMACSVWVELGEKLCAAFSARPSQTCFFQEEIDTQIGLLHGFVVDDCEQANS